MSNASTAAHTLNTVSIFIHIILQLVHKPLAHPLHFGTSGIVTGSVQGKERIHTAIPVAHAYPGKSQSFVLNVKTPAGRANISAGSAVYTCKSHFFPERGFKKFGCLFIF
jgi:hypothetical protein